MFRRLVALLFTLAASLSAASLFTAPEPGATATQSLLVPFAAVAAALLGWITLAHFAWPRDLDPSVGRRRFLLALLLVTTPSVVVLLRGAPPTLALTWVGRSSAGIARLETFTSSTQWGSTRSGFELHAAADSDSLHVWSASAALPPIFRLLGSRIQLDITQPAWVIFDTSGYVQRGSDGVTVQVVGYGSSGRSDLQSLPLNLHARQEQRKWHRIAIALPAGARQIALELKPGPVGSNNWFDRIWISEVGVTPGHYAMLAVAKALAFTLALWTFVLVLRSAVFGDGSHVDVDNSR